MARLFIGQREIDFVNDLTKEYIKDVIGFKIFYYPISEIKTKIHDVYNEGSEKIYDSPIEIDALVSPPVSKFVTNKYGSESEVTVEVRIQYADITDKNISIVNGDFFTFGEHMFEILSVDNDTAIFGQVEHKLSLVLTARMARQGQFEARIFGPTDIQHTDADAVQTTFVQQEGFSENRLGPTNDRRAMIEKGVLELNENGPKEVSPRGGDHSDDSSFYDE